MNLRLSEGRFITGIAASDDVNRRGDRFLLEADAVGWEPEVPVVFADRPGVPIGEVFRFKPLPESLAFSALIDDEAPHWPEISSGLRCNVALGFRANEFHLNAFGGVTFDRWVIEELIIMPPGWASHDRGAQIISADEGDRELRFGIRVWPKPMTITPRSPAALQRWALKCAALK